MDDGQFEKYNSEIRNLLPEFYRFAVANIWFSYIWYQLYRFRYNISWLSLVLKNFFHLIRRSLIALTIKSLLSHIILTTVPYFMKRVEYFPIIRTANSFSRPYHSNSDFPLIVLLKHSIVRNSYHFGFGIAFDIELAHSLLVHSSMKVAFADMLLFETNIHPPFRNITDIHSLTCFNNSVWNAFTVP